ncbi:CHRD domain-containing protein [candidate division KSB1 bacterium]|nr:CHRD domain-containing protein [candidate division KSB1 bacterium]
MRSSILFVSLCLIVFLISSTSFSQTHFTAKLTGEQENPAVTTSATGTGAFVLTDAGLAFTVTVEGLEFTAAHFHNEAVGVNGGVVRTITGDFAGNTTSGVWTETDGEPLTNALMGELLNGNIYLNIHTAANAGGEIRGQLSPVDIVTSVERIEDTVEVPKDFTLLQNFPNPFNPSTEIRFNLNQSSPTVLKIYNLKGQEVATLLDEELLAGSYKVTFEPTNLPSGVYVYRLESVGQIEARKMILLK